MNGIPHLTAAQRAILHDVSEGYTNRAIAKRHHLAVTTVKNHMFAIYDILCPGRDANTMDARVVAAIWWREVGKEAYERFENDKTVLGPYSDLGTQHLHVMFGERRAG